MSNTRVWAGLGAVAIGAIVLLGAGAVLGVGPLASATPPEQVTDPKEMLARSLQATLDANAVHFDGTVSGTIPGSLVDRPEPSIDLDGTTLEIDVRPKDAKTKTHLASEALEVELDTVTVWDGAWYRTAPDQPWTRASLGGASAEAGVDINPLTLVDRPEPSIDLAGTTLEIDLRPKDAKTKTHLTSEPLEVELDTVTVWDGAWYRTAPDQPWARASLGGASAEAGVDINPLSLVDRLRAYLATPGTTVTSRDVTCASESGRCHEISLDAGSDPVMILGLMLPHERAEQLPPVDVVITLQTDALTLRPAQLIAEATSEDGTIDIRTVIDASRWDEDIVIEEPSESEPSAAPTPEPSPS